MPWHDGEHAGFAPPGAPGTWLPLHPESATKNVARQRQDSTSVLSTYRRMLHLRRRSRALSSGSLELLGAPGSREAVLAYRRVYEDANVRETAEVFLNFSDREVGLDLRELAGRPGSSLHSNLHDQPVKPERRHRLRAWEGAVVLSDHRA